ncbi:hypothetical protein C0431_15305 [bacterium]|nr:hypothetical protein [bacterium]
MILKATEGMVTWLPGVLLSDLPKGLPPSIRCHSRSGVLGIEPQGVVGTFPLSTGASIHILPKIGKANFLKLLARAQGLGEQAIRDFDTYVQYTDDSEANLDALLCRRLLACVDAILRLSPESARRRITRAGLYAVGRIVPDKTAQRLALHDAQPVVCEYRERTTDTPENRLLTEAIVRAWPLLTPSDQATFRRTYCKWIRLFPRSATLWLDCQQIDEKLARNSYGRSRDYYREALLAARILLSAEGIGFDGKQTVVGDALLINSADVFEKFVRRALQEAYSSQGLVVKKGASTPISLYHGGQFELIPDIVISKDVRVLLLADAKYKAPDASDHYQMQAYLTAFGCRRGLFICPAYNDEPESVKEFQTSTGTIVSELYLPMGSIKRAEQLLSGTLQRFGN